MTDFLYQLCIAPLEALMRLLLFAAHDATGNWGLSIALMSIGVNIVLIPVYHLAESWQEAEREMQRRMAPKAKELREFYKGRERDAFLRGLYKIHGYSPVYALRTSAGLLIQIPFFFAAFHLLNGLPELAGQGLWFIRDLSAPDGLLPLNGHAVNVLPFVMTAVNLASAAVYASRLTTRDKVQLYGLAALFLVLLYNSAAALLVYWTCNNIISCLKNFIYVRFIYDAEAKQPFRLRLPALSLPVWAARRPKTAEGAAIFFSIVFCVLGLVLRKHAPFLYAVLPPFIFSAVCLGFALALRSRSLSRDGENSLPGLPFLWFGALGGMCSWFLPPLAQTFVPASFLTNICLGILTAVLPVWIFSIPPWGTRLASFFRRAEEHCPAARVRTIFYSGVLTLLVLVWIYTPALIYSSDPSCFSESPGELAARLVQRLLLALAACVAFFRLLPPKARTGTALFAFGTALCGVVYTFAVTPDYGLMDDVIFRNPGAMKSKLAYIVDPAVCFASFTLLVFAVKAKKTAAVASAGKMLCGVLLFAGVYYVATAETKEAPAGAEAPAARAAGDAENIERIMTFSTTGKNTVIFMMDMFAGGHMPELVRDSPEVIAEYEGFQWFPDTVAAGSSTFLSLPSLLGGPEYTPRAIVRRNPEDVTWERHKGYAVLPDFFAAKGYDTAFADLDIFRPYVFEQVSKQFKKILLIDGLAKKITPAWREAKGLPALTSGSDAPFLAVSGVFYASPWLVRPFIYNEGEWANTRAQAANPTESALAQLEMLPKLSRTAQNGNTLKYYANWLAHRPWRLDGNTGAVVSEKRATRLPDGSILEQRRAEQISLAAFAEWFRWMKENGVYDNTRIIIVSDHDAGESPVMGRDFDDLYKSGMAFAPHSLLLFKDFNARGPMKRDDRQMSSADVPGLVCKDVPDCGFPDPLARTAPALRTHAANRDPKKTQGKSAYETSATFQVNGTMFERRNWRELAP